jgi:hypothetical protein
MNQRLVLELVELAIEDWIESQRKGIAISSV